MAASSSTSAASSSTSAASSSTFAASSSTFAASSSTFAASISAAVPQSFHYETRYVVLNYLGMFPAAPAPSQGDVQNEREKTRMIKEQIEEELRRLEDEISASFSSTGFNRLTSLVFNPTSPENSVEDCLAAMGDKVSGELDSHLAAAVETLLTRPLDYQNFRNTTLDLSSHTQGGWNKVVVPLVLLQSLQKEGKPLKTLLDVGLRYLEEDEAAFITQQGGWGEVLGLVSEEERGVAIAEDSNDIYILSGEHHPELSPPSSLLCTGDTSSEQNSWQTESFPVSLAGHESWAQVGMMDPEDVKSLDSTEGGVLAEERSENNSSNSDIVHVEREEAELLEEGGAIEESMMSVLGTESELAELREEFRDQNPPDPASDPASDPALDPAQDQDQDQDLDQDLDPARFTPPASLVSLEEPVVVETPASLSAEPSLVSSEPELPPAEPEPAAPSPVPAVEPEPEPEPAAAPPVPVEVETKETPEPEPEPTAEPAPEPEPEPVSVPQGPEEPEPETEPPVPQAAGAPVEEVPVEEVLVEEVLVEEVLVEEVLVQPVPASELQVLLYGGAALVVLAAVMAYGVLRLRRK